LSTSVASAIASATSVAAAATTGKDIFDLATYPACAVSNEFSRPDPISDGSLRLFHQNSKTARLPINTVAVAVRMYPVSATHPPPSSSVIAR